MEDKDLKEKHSELELKNLDLKVQLQEVELKERLSAIKQKKQLNQSLLIAIIGGFTGILAAGFSSWFQHRDALKEQQIKLKTSLILGAIDTDENQKAIHILKFLIDIKLISDDKLQKILNDSTRWGEIPAVNGDRSMVIVQDVTRKPLEGMTVMYDGAVFGVTNRSGQVSMFLAADEPVIGGEFDISDNGVLYDIVAYNLTKTNTTVLTVEKPGVETNNQLDAQKN
jgi:hypothetical protein